MPVASSVSTTSPQTSSYSKSPDAANSGNIASGPATSGSATTSSSGSTLPPSATHSCEPCRTGADDRTDMTGKDLTTRLHPHPGPRPIAAGPPNTASGIQSPDASVVLHTRRRSLIPGTAASRSGAPRRAFAVSSAARARAQPASQGSERGANPALLERELARRRLAAALGSAPRPPAWRARWRAPGRVDRVAHHRDPGLRQDRCGADRRAGATERGAVGAGTNGRWSSPPPRSSLEGQRAGAQSGSSSRAIFPGAGQAAGGEFSGVRSDRSLGHKPLSAT
jgi:hypothetical protein